VFIFAGYSFEWHIEYRNADGTGLSPDPSDPDKTFRVRTLYVAEDLLAKKSQPAFGKQQSDPIETGGGPFGHPGILGPCMRHIAAPPKGLLKIVDNVCKQTHFIVRANRYVAYGP